jgi:hypothetical protein
MPPIQPIASPQVASPGPRRGANITWAAFLVMCFAVVGLVGVFGTFASALPLRREIAREATLDEAVLAVRGPNPDAAIAALKDRLDDSAATLIPLPANPEAAISAERLAMRARFVAEAAATSSRVQMMIAIVTVMAAVFGSALMAFGARSASPM